ncbi:hypothetical protein [Terracoccus sp. 273MFTsu3.1]|uniref:hypothetical protein n=1 Tax=Terracoccus sp. 273MFTsu3.1 TaxID=1172188 RepID=UPI00037E4BA2|nr:hypothetical protein [Terracoccus sp. 273MFTsu3.1]
MTDPTILPRPIQQADLARTDHVHDDMGVCIKNRYAERCAPFYCEKCHHPSGYHDPERGCTMPINHRGLPANAGDPSRPCACGRPRDLLVEDIINFAEERLGIDLLPWQKTLMRAVLGEMEEI